MIIRPRRLRRSQTIRKMVRETTISVEDFIAPLFVVPGDGRKEPISTLPGQFHFSVDTVVEEADVLWGLGVPGVILFGLPDRKDGVGSRSYAEDGVVQRAIGAIKSQIPHMVVITDVCLCEYTDHGHCGVIVDGKVANDETLEILARQSVSHAQAGADMVAPSDMMDGRVSAIRKALDDHGCQETGILSYAVKYASLFMAPSGRPPTLRPSLETGPAIKWIRPMPVKR